MEQNKIQKRPEWTEYFLDIARAVGRRATCLRRRYGAIIVKDRIIISTGYNGAPRGEANCIIINADPADMEGATIYIVGINADGTLASGKPCLLCRRMLRNAKLAQVVYYETDGSIVTCRPDEIHD